VQVASLAIRTGISPAELAELDEVMLAAMWRVLDHQAKEVNRGVRA
jgi:hypothetical protein